MSINSRVSWECISTRDYMRDRHTEFHRFTLSDNVTALDASAFLPSPSGSMMYPFYAQDFPSDEFRVVGNFRGKRAGPQQTSFFSECCFSYRRRIDGHIGKMEMRQGVKLYRQHKIVEAVEKWDSALKKVYKRDQRFAILGHLFQAHIDCGLFKGSLDYANWQISVSEEVANSQMKAEGYSNMALAQERLGCLDQALIFARQSLFHENSPCLTSGTVNITLGSVYLEKAVFKKSLMSFRMAYKIARTITNSELELQAYIGMSELFLRLHDIEQSAMYASKAYDISRSLHSRNLNTRHHRAALIQMAATLCKLGELGDAQDYCAEAVKFSMLSIDTEALIRTHIILGDILRLQFDMKSALTRYRIMTRMSQKFNNDKCHMHAMHGASKCLSMMNRKKNKCNCSVLECWNKLLIVANSVGAKFLISNLQEKLAELYKCLQDEEHQKMCERHVKALRDEFKLNCGVCSELFGLEPDRLEALPCGHIIHARCAYNRVTKKDYRNGPCLDCQREAKSKLFIYSNVSEIDGDKSPLSSPDASQRTSNLE